MIDKYRQRIGWLSGIETPHPKYEDGETMSVEELINVVHHYLPYTIRINDLASLAAPSKGMSTTVYMEQRKQLTAFLENTGPQVFKFDQKIKDHSVYVFNSKGTWGVYAAQIWIKDPNLISAIKLAFG